VITTVVDKYHWPPEVIGGLFIDDEDYEGILFWYNLIEEERKQLTAKTK